MAAHRKLASKIFCLCCRDCEEPHSTDDSTIPSETQEQQTGVRKLQLDQQNPKYANKASGLALRQPLAHPEKDSTSSSDFEECPQRGFYKRNLDRYSQNHWPFQPCLIGRP
ncbi:testis expressed 48 [Phyllostomus discolor]|uniref:Testis expressed 48 n=1 Tax=Phyllostomus discolor TaxID=89673 RepID=A0A834ESK2_9CHIR|nr:testis expressed 48 [Phyllostomus discolor]